jgi:tetratricopeptide (TPR) repeat protein
MCARYLITSLHDILQLMKYAVVLLLVFFLSPKIYAQTSPKAQPVQELCREAREQLNQGKYALARETAKGALKLNSRSAEAQSLVGQAEFALGNLPAAVEHLREALKIDPGQADARRALGATYLRLKRFEAAQGEFEAALRSRPDDLACLYGLGFSLLSQNKPSQALGPLVKAQRLSPSDPELLTGILQAHLELGQPVQAEAALTELNRQLANDYPQQMQLAAFLVKQGAYDLAIAQFKHLLKSKPDSYDLNYNLALAYQRAGKEDLAATQIHKMLGQKDKAELENLLGEVEATRGNYSQALTAYRQAAVLQPKSEDYQLDYAREMALHSNPNEALKMFAGGVKRFPNSATWWMGLGGCYYLVGKYKEAAETLLHASRLAAGNSNVYALLGLAYDAAGPLKTPIAQRFDDYLKKNPGDAVAHYFYGKILLDQNQGNAGSHLEQAQRELNKAVELKPGLAPAHLELAKLLKMRGDTTAARAQLETVVRLNPESSDAYYQLMQVYRKLGQTQEAAMAAEKFQRLKNLKDKEANREQVKKLLSGAKH